ncbi:MAG: DUF1501 domain-containing protein [Planctomycetota bacterium]|nr:DUF1501 domain-containing protein [Planctomycetota bacterium]
MSTQSQTPFLGPVPRRELLQSVACGFGGLALHSLLAGMGQGGESGVSAKTLPGPHHAPRAKRVIFLFMAGGPSQLDMFDPKPFIAQKHGQRISPPIDGREVTVGVDRYLALGPAWPAKPRGQSGVMISDLLPQLAQVADDICLLRGMHTDNEAHAPASLQLHTGASIDVRPSMGAWFSYGLGTENQNLPGFITIHPDSDVRTYGSSFLPAAHQGTPVTVPAKPEDSPIRYLRDADASPAIQEKRLGFLQNMNRKLRGRVGEDPQMEGLIQSFELAFRMQRETPGLLDLNAETPAMLETYGIGPGKPSDRNGRACLLARRLSEAGVRFVQVTMGGWDHHGDIRGALPGTCASVDQPIAGLLRDLKARGLLDDTLIVWSGEFGRTPWSQDLSGTSPIEKHGREHQPEGYCAFLAGAGVKSGMMYGQTDDFGFQPVEGAVHLYDMHATIMHLMGIDHERLTWRHSGRDYRLTDVYGRVVNEVLA